MSRLPLPFEPANVMRAPLGDQWPPYSRRASVLTTRTWSSPFGFMVNRSSAPIPRNGLSVLAGGIFARANNTRGP